MKLRAKVTLIVLLLSVITLILFAVWRHIQNSVLDKDGMVYEMNIVSVYYIKGGGMDGARTEISVKYNEENGTADYLMKKRGFWNEPDETTECMVDPAIFSDIQEVVSVHRLVSASDKPLSKDIVLDAASSTLDIRFETGKEIRLEDRQLLSREEFDACRQIVEILENSKYRISG